jgi:hypothetical protein
MMLIVALLFLGYTVRGCVDSVQCTAFNAGSTCSSLQNVTFAGVTNTTTCNYGVCLKCSANKTQFAYSSSCACSSGSLLYANVPTSNVCVFIANAVNIVSMVCAVVVPTTPPKTPAPIPQLSDGAIAGVLVGLAVATGAVVGLVMFVKWRQRKRKDLHLLEETL